MRKLGLILIPLLVIACGKSEILTKAKEVVGKSIQDGINVTTKAVNDTALEVGRGITRGNDIKNEIAVNTGNFGEGLASGVETVVQAPKKAVNQLLGNDEESEEKQRSLENELELTQEELAELQDQVNEIYSEMILSFSEVNQELGDLKGEIERVESESNEADQALSNELDAIHTEILQELNRLDRKDRRALSKIRQLQSKLRSLKSLVRELRRDIGNLEATCRTYRNMDTIITIITIELIVKFI